MGNNEQITIQDLPADLQRSVPAHEEADRKVAHDLKTALETYERIHIETVLRETGADRTRTAKLLGMSRSQLYRKIESLGIQIDDVAGAQNGETFRGNPLD